jgi:hypothetical protein
MCGNSTPHTMVFFGIVKVMPSRVKVNQIGLP